MVLGQLQTGIAELSEHEGERPTGLSPGVGKLRASVPREVSISYPHQKFFE